MTSRWSVEVILEVSEKSEVIDLSLHISWREITNSDDQVEARNRTLTLHHCLPTSELPAREVRKCWEDNYQSLYQRNSDRQLVYTLFCLYHVLLGIDPSLTWKSTPTSVLPAGEVMGVSGGQLTTFTI